MRGWLTGMRPWLLAAIVATVISALMVFAELQSPDAAMWNGQALSAVNRHGFVTYEYHGVSYTTNRLSVSDAAARELVTVYVEPNDLANPILDSASSRAFDLTLMAGPLFVAGLLIATGVLRREVHRYRRRKAARAGVETHGWGIDPGVMEQILEHQRRGAPRE